MVDIIGGNNNIISGGLNIEFKKTSLSCGYQNRFKLD